MHTAPQATIQSAATRIHQPVATIAAGADFGILVYLRGGGVTAHRRTAPDAHLAIELEGETPVFVVTRGDDQLLRDRDATVAVVTFALIAHDRSERAMTVARTLLSLAGHRMPANDPVLVARAIVAARPNDSATFLRATFEATLL